MPYTYGGNMATSLWSPFFTFLTGIVSSSYYRTPSRRQVASDRVAPDFYQFLYNGFGSITDPLALVFLGAPLVLNHLGLEPLVRKVVLVIYAFLSLGYLLLLFSVVRSFLMPLSHAPFHVSHAFAPTSQWFLPISSSSMALLVYQELGGWGRSGNFNGLLGPSPASISYHESIQKD